MMKKVLAAVALAILAIFAVPASAFAGGYVPDSAISISGAVVPGGTVTVNIPANTYLSGETVQFAVTCPGTPTLAVFKAGTATLNRAATASGAASVTVGLPTSPAGTCNCTATGLTSGNIVTWTLVVAAASSSTGSAGALPGTGYQLPAVLLWSAAGALLIGIAMLVVLVLARRRHAHADS